MNSTLVYYFLKKESLFLNSTLGQPAKRKSKIRLLYIYFLMTTYDIPQI